MGTSRYGWDVCATADTNAMGACTAVKITVEGVGDGFIDDLQDPLDRGYLLTFA